MLKPEGDCCLDHFAVFSRKHHMGSAHLAVVEVVGPDPPSKSLREQAPHHLHGDFAW